jgi:uncharacterized repeat protein (TIGR01451 family)
MADFFRGAAFRFFVVLFSLGVSQIFGQEAQRNDGSFPKPAQDAGGKESAPAPSPSPTVPIHIVPYGAPATPPKAQPKTGGRSSNNGRVQYWGGPVISQVQPVVVLWGNFVDSGSTGGIQQFLTDIVNTNYLDLLAEYSTVGLTGFGGAAGSNQTISPHAFSVPKFTISPSLCPGSAGGTACAINDAQIQAEILAQINGGHLPQPVRDAQGNFETLYMTYFPPGVTITAGGANSCQDFGFCAYHSNVSSGSPSLPYGVFPDFSQGGCSPTFGGCGPGTAFQNLTSASSHELSEAVTDPDVGTATAFAPPLGWADQFSGAEIGDFCNQNDSQVTVNGTTYTVQAVWSNLQGLCTTGPGQFALTLGTNNAPPGVPFQVTVEAQTHGGGSTILNYNDTVHFTSTDGAATLPADYTFVPSTDNGGHTFTVTMGSIGSQTITVTDTLITGMNGSGSIDIEHNPDLTVTLSHSGNFKQGDIGDTYTLTVTNVGDVATNTTQVNLNVGGAGGTFPDSLTPTAISGTGWNCNLGGSPGGPSCTRSDSLAAHTAYPAITLTVNVSVAAPASALPQAQVSGGGELNVSNDVAIDPTTIIQFADLVCFSSHNGAFSQGQIGATYALSAANVGFAPTSGTVTLTDTLPAGLTATAISGTGWSCSTPPTLSCTRSDALAVGSNYPAVTLTVNVDPAAPMPTVTNTVMVSGGGEINTGNDSNTDITTIIPATPDVVIASTHSGNFTQGQTGATYTLTVSNIGPAATTGTVTASDSLPGDFTATAITGAGWSCLPLPVLNCSRNDALGAFTGGSPSSYPPITVTLNVSPTAFTSDTNFVSVSGGGEFNTGNDSNTDPTTINQLPNLIIGQNLGSTLAQGLMGANYALTVSNINGLASTIGTVTVTESLSSGLAATAISGSGWNCALGSLSCTRSDSLGPNGSYPSILVTVNVAANAPSTVTSTATVSGGGEIITGDDTSINISPIQPPLNINPFSTQATVKAGNLASFLIGLNAPLPGAVTVTCSSGVPPGASCVIFPGSFTAPFNGNVSITVPTTGPLPAAMIVGGFLPGGLGRGNYGQVNGVAALVACLSCVLMLAGRNKRAGKRRPGAVVAVFCVLMVLLLVPGCGGGGSSGPSRVVTPPGTYTITLTVNNSTANTQATTPLTLTVQ